MTDSSDDERLADLITECGLEGYGFWWRLLEVVASHVDKNGEKCSVSYSLANWSRLLYCHHHKVGKYLGKLEVRGMVRVGYGEGNGYSKIEVTIPNLLKYRDEYSRKSGHKQDKLPAKNIDTDTEADTDKDLKDIAVPAEKPAAPARPPKIGFNFETGAFTHINGQAFAWSKAYPAVDIDQEINKAAAWLVSNPDQKKKDYARFLNAWLSRCQNSVRLPMLPGPGSGRKSFEEQRLDATKKAMVDFAGEGKP